MHLASLALTNFRACRDTKVVLSPDLTVLVGENASGKSAIVEAIRLATYPASGRTTAWFSADRDLNHGCARGAPVSIAARYGDLTEDEKAIYLAELVDSHEDLIYQATFATDPSTPRRSVLSWSVGDSMCDDPEPLLRRRISHVYLPPLRDAVRDIDQGDQAQLYEVLQMIVGTNVELEADFLEKANDALDVVAAHDLAQQVRQSIEHYFTQTTPPNREHRLELNRRDLELRRISRLLRLQLAERDVAIGDIAATGLGYANLLYISMIVLQLARRHDSDLTVLLVEEPEAHLHPQLQLVLLDFLQSQARSSALPEAGTAPATHDASPGDGGAGSEPLSGKVQVVVTTHSPVLASTVSVDNVVVVARDSAGAGWVTKTTALSSLGLKPSDRRKVDRYLTSTRSALLFARDILLVEGIAEVLLIPALAAYQFDDPTNPPEERATLRRQFRSASVISVEGVDFEPYLTLLLAGENPRVDRVVVVTDGDHGAGETRKRSYESTFPNAVAEQRLHVLVGGTTLEAEFFREEGNETLLREAFEVLHPSSKHHWDKVVAEGGADRDLRAEIFAAAISAKSAKERVYLNIGKGDFSHLVAEAIYEGSSRDLVVPEYLRRAIELVSHADCTPGPEESPPVASTDRRGDQVTTDPAAMSDGRMDVAESGSA